GLTATVIGGDVVDVEPPLVLLPALQPARRAKIVIANPETRMRRPEIGKGTSWLETRGLWAHPTGSERTIAIKIWNKSAIAKFLSITEVRSKDLISAQPARFARQ